MAAWCLPAAAAMGWALSLMEMPCLESQLALSPSVVFFGNVGLRKAAVIGHNRALVSILCQPLATFPCQDLRGAGGSSMDSGFPPGGGTAQFTHSQLIYEHGPCCAPLVSISSLLTSSQGWLRGSGMRQAPRAGRGFSSAGRTGACSQDTARTLQPRALTRRSRRGRAVCEWGTGSSIWDKGKFTWQQGTESHQFWPWEIPPS